jgi:hypothetical protein
MRLYHALTAQNTEKSNHTNRNIALGLIALTAIFVIVTAGTLASISITNASPQQTNPPNTATAHVETLISKQITVEYGATTLYAFGIPDDATNATLTGTFNSTAPTNNGVTVIVRSLDDYLNYLSNKNSRPIYNSDLMPASSGTFNVSLSSGIYFLFFSSAIYNTTQYVNAEISYSYYG